MSSEKRTLTNKEDSVKKRARHEEPSDGLKALKRIIASLKNNKNYPPFAEPVDPVALEIPDYFEIIHKPMDLGTIQGNIDTNSYNNSMELAVSDIALVWSNCYKYNPAGSEVSDNAVQIQRMLIKKMESMPSIFTRELIDITRTPHPNMYKDSYEEASPPPSQQATRKRPVSNSSASQTRSSSSGGGSAQNRSNEIKLAFPKIKPNLDDVLKPFEGDTVPLTMDDKENMFCIIDSLPQKYLDKVVEFIQKTTPHTAEVIDKDTVEFDLDNFEVRVQRHLMSYLNDCQTVLNNAKQRKTAEQKERDEKEKEKERDGSGSEGSANGDAGTLTGTNTGTGSDEGGSGADASVGDNK